MEGASHIDIYQVIKVLGERILDVTIKQNTCRVDQDVKATEFLDHSESHLVLLDVDTEIALDYSGLSWILLAYRLKGIYISADEGHSRSLIQVVVSEGHPEAT